MKTRRPPVENGEYAAFARRVLRAYARRISAGDIDALTDMTALAADVEKSIRQAVTGLRDYGYSWAEIGPAGKRWSHDQERAPDRTGEHQPGLRHPVQAGGRPPDHHSRHAPDVRLAAGRARRSPACGNADPETQQGLTHDGDLHSGARQGDQGRTQAAE
jgi:hypothetical protein